MSNDDDDAFIQAFESGRLSNAEFHHRDHVRLTWLYLRRDGPELGAQRVIDGIRHFATAHGAADRFHVTLTWFWIRLVQHLMEAFPSAQKVDDLFAAFPPVNDKSTVYHHYSQATLWSAEARHSRLTPDLLPMP
jgi:hypothetical protein